MGLEGDGFLARLINQGGQKRRSTFAAIYYRRNHDRNSRYHIENQAMHSGTIYKQKKFSTNDLARFNTVMAYMNP